MFWFWLEHQDVWMSSTGFKLVFKLVPEQKLADESEAEDETLGLKPNSWNEILN